MTDKKNKGGRPSKYNDWQKDILDRCHHEEYQKIMKIAFVSTPEIIALLISRWDKRARNYGNLNNDFEEQRQRRRLARTICRGLRRVNVRVLLESFLQPNIPEQNSENGLIENPINKKIRTVDYNENETGMIIRDSEGTILEINLGDFFASGSNNVSLQDLADRDKKWYYANVQYTCSGMKLINPDSEEKFVPYMPMEFNSGDFFECGLNDCTPEQLSKTFFSWYYRDISGQKVLRKSNKG
jgi:hypothetical protein